MASATIDKQSAALSFLEEAFDSRPDDEDMADSARATLLSTLKQFKPTQEDGRLLALAFLESKAATFEELALDSKGEASRQRDKLRKGLLAALITYRGGPTRTTTKTTARAAKKEPRITWRYFPFPIAIWDDSELSDNAKLAAGKIARSINLGPWNTDLHTDLSYAAFGLGSVSTAQRAVAELRDAGYIKMESLNRGGVRYWFTEKAADKTE